MSLADSLGSGASAHLPLLNREASRSESLRLLFARARSIPQNRLFPPVLSAGHRDIHLQLLTPVEKIHLSRVHRSSSWVSRPLPSHCEPDCNHKLISPRVPGLPPAVPNRAPEIFLPLFSGAISNRDRSTLPHLVLETGCSKEEKLPSSFPSSRFLF